MFTSINFARIDTFTSRIYIQYTFNVHLVDAKGICMVECVILKLVVGNIILNLYC